MAFVSKEKSKTVKQELEAAFPKKDGWKFSVTIEHYTTLRVAVMTAPINLIDSTDEFDLKRNHQTFNDYYLNCYKESETLTKIKEIANKGNFDHSDSQSDYFHVGFYFNLEAGKWNKPFEVVQPKTAKTKAVEVPVATVKTSNIFPF